MVCQRGFWTFSAVCSLLHLVGVVEFGARAQSDAGDVVTMQPSQSSGTGGDSSTNRAGGYKLSSSQVFTFLKESSFLRVEPKYWPLQHAREVSFQFKTEKPHGLLFYHLLEESSEEDRVPNYELYVMLENGRLKIIHIFNTEGNEVFYMGKGLNQDRWHTVNLRVVPSKGEMRIRVDHEDLTIILSSLMHRGGYDIGTEDTPSHLYIGSIDPRNSSVDLHYNTDSFFGCLGKISFHLGDGAPVEASLVAREDVIDGCVDLCSKYDYCLNGGRCVNHYSYYGCDCFGTRYEDHMCGYDNLTTVTLRGNSYITYRIYDWKDRVHSDSNRIGIVFRLYVPEAVLFTVTGEHDPKNEVAASVKGGMLFFHLDFGDGPFNVTMGANLHDQMWHNFTMIHNANQVSLYLDKLSHSIRLTDTNHHLHLDPDLYIGGVPLTSRDGTAVFPGLVTDLKLVGCIREVYFNRDNCLQSLRKGEPNARHIGIFPVEYGCALVDTIPLTFPFAESRLKLNLPSARRLDISVDFKTHQNETVIASSLLRSDKGQGFWEIRLKKGTAIFTIVPDETNPSHYWFLSKGKQLTDGQWHQVGVVFENEVVELTIDFNRKLRDTYNRPVELVGPLVIGGFPKEHVMGFVGCIRDIYVAKEWVDPRKVVGTEYAHGEVSLDNCRLINLCNNPNACEHGGQCYLEGNQFKCNCNGTGYTGKTCHFSTYKRTCQELFLVGYRKSGTYKIDIDRNGPLPPAHVECDMQRPDGSIATKVNHNMQREMVVRKYGLEGFYMDITYREFTPEMLQSLIYASKQCYQHITYECFKAPLGLQSYTWMESSADNRYVSSIGSDHPAWCQCAETRSCSNASRLCNCDVGDARWRLDEGVYHRKEDLGIVRIYMLQPKGLAHDAEARMTLGPLECTDTNTQQYVITFKTAPSYLEVQTGWRRGDLAFSFRTSSKRAVVLYQAALHDKHGYLLAMITSDYELSFEYTVNGEPRIVKLLSRSRLNTGEWQQVWLDHDTHHMRFTVNLDSVMVDLGKDEGVGPFEGPLYIGGAPKDLLTHPDITEGFIGCFRGLIINNHVVNLYNHLSRRVPDIVMDCQPSCSSNPCQNGATCHENWGSYNCECENSLAHSGTNCENNLNQNSMTFITSSSCYHRATLGNISDPVLAENILLSFRTYQSEALLLYSFNHLNNFVQLHFEKRKRVVFTFNSQRSIVQGFVEAPDLATGRIVQVFVDRHADYTVLQVNGNNVTIPHPAVFLTTYYKDPWIQGEQLELVKPARGTFESVPNSQMYLGGVDFMGATTNLPGLVGCLQGLRIGNVQVDLIKDVENQNVTKGQIRPGCKMMCDSTPCHHSGLCIEDWKNNLTSCDCSMTSYQGDVCQTDIGAQFDGKAWIEYMFMPETSGQDRISILLAFSTKAKASVRQAILLVQYAQSQHYVLVAVTPEGALQIQENHASAKVFGKQTGNFADGFRHWLHYKRIENDARVVVDGKEYVLTSTTPDTSGPTVDISSSLVVVGGTKRDPRFGDYGDFQGCVSNVVVELRTLNIRPLETYFGYQKGALEKVKVYGTLREGRCAEFAAIIGDKTEAIFKPPAVNVPEWHRVNPVLVPYKNNFFHPQATKLLYAKATSTRVAVIMAVVLIVVLIGVFLYAWRLQKRHKHQKLREDMSYFRRGGGSYSTANPPKRKSNNSPVKAVSFSSRNNDYRPLPQTKNEMLSSTPRPSVDIVKARSPSIAMNSSPPKPILNNRNSTPLALSPIVNGLGDLKSKRPVSTASQELEWDPAADSGLLTSAELSAMDPGDEDGLPETPRKNSGSEEMLSNVYKLADYSGSLIFTNTPYESASD
ncbi:contactin-associated protein-like 5 isoform X2 [Ixodes scapularis]|uniref:contactin-associated protein-like 5 isoform X2 n=1 Tax=Ixodes scapularis TaxID=6945 RepID=UPI001C387179|nr:contactin-associated protein-like 5 isoform X2 [Ixodes scapularis]XP_042142681.1 contactin-associated protein-like 5 isoform X2 [Ixodes scapularis]